MRTVSMDPGLMTAEELLANSKGGRRKTLEDIIARHEYSSLYPMKFRWSCCTHLRKHVLWFIDKGRLQISVSAIIIVGYILNKFSFISTYPPFFNLLISVRRFYDSCYVVCIVWRLDKGPFLSTISR